MATNESLIKIEIKGSSTAGAPGVAGAPGSPPTGQLPAGPPPQEDQTQSKPRRRRAKGNRQEPEGDDTGEQPERAEPGFLAKLISTIVTGQIVYHVRQVTGLFTGEQRIARMVVQSQEFGNLVVKASDKLSSIVEATFGKGGGEWVKNMGREVSTAFNTQYSRARTYQRQPTSQPSLRAMADEPEGSPRDKNDSVIDVLPANGGPSASRPSVAEQSDTTIKNRGVDQGQPSVSSPAGKSQSSGNEEGGGTSKLLIAGIALAATYATARVIDVAGNYVASKIRSVGDLLGNVASTRILPVDRIFAGVVDKAGDMLSALGFIPGSILKVGASIVSASIAIKDSLLQRAQELRGLSPDIAAASANSEIKQFQRDRKEAEILGPQLARLINAQSKIDDLGQDISIGIRAGLTESILPVMELLAGLSDGFKTSNEKLLEANKSVIDATNGQTVVMQSKIQELIESGKALSMQGVVLSNNQIVNEQLDILFSTGQKGGNPFAKTSIDAARTVNNNPASSSGGVLSAVSTIAKEFTKTLILGPIHI